MKNFDKNKDGEIDMQDIYYIITDLMKQQSKQNISGFMKHYNVMNVLKTKLPTDIYTKFEPLLDTAIDFIFDIANHKKILNGLKKNCKCII